MDFTRKKIGLISFHSFQSPGGVKNHTLGLAQEFRRRGIETKVIAPRRSRSENYGKNVILLGTSFPMPFNDSQGDLVVNFNPFAVRKVLSQEHFDVLHLHNFSLPSAFEILAMSKACNVLTFHAHLDKSEILRRFPAFLTMFKKVAGWRIDGVIGVSPLVMDIFESYKGLKTVIPNGVDLAKFQAGAPVQKYRDGKINILFVGRIEKRKGLIYLLRAFEALTKRHENLRLLVVGKGELKKQCEDFVKTHGLKEVHFLGEVPDEKLVSWYKTADIFCSPAPHGESFGIVLLEAMAAGLPVVGFANPGYLEFLKGTRVEPFLVPPGNVKALVSALEKLIDEEQLRKELGQWGREKAQEYSWEKVADRILAFYEQVISRKESAS
ncbi:MAG: glycosyltransferase family 4 protein [Candidatus Pacearchaeota archaeon]|nr:glycosyltransferase family 4 protein [Candidatus Pacearchaeota archaeon]